VLGRVVAGEEASIPGAGGFIVGGLVVGVEVAPIAPGLAIEEGAMETNYGSRD